MQDIPPKILRPHAVRFFLLFKSACLFEQNACFILLNRQISKMLDTLMVFLKDFEKVNFEKKSAVDKKIFVQNRVHVAWWLLMINDAGVTNTPICVTCNHLMMNGPW